MVSWNTLVKCAITRFTPGVCTFLGVGYLINASRNELTLASTAVGGMALLVPCFTVGFIATLGVMRTRLHETARADGRRTFIAGFASVALLFAMQVLYVQAMYIAHPPRLALWALATIAGALTTFAVFFPKLRTRMAHLERTANGQLYSEVVNFAERATSRDAVVPRRTRTT